jgi:hypothetical protein
MVSLTVRFQFANLVVRYRTASGFVLEVVFNTV